MMELVEDTPAKPHRTRFEAAAVRSIDAHWVALIAWRHSLPRHWGDNVGAWPVHVETSQDWRQTGLRFDRQQPVAQAVRLVVMGVRGKGQAAALKQGLDDALGGREREADADPLRLRYHNMVASGGPDDFATWWVPLLQDVILRAGPDFDVGEAFSRTDYEARVQREAARLIERDGRRARETV